MVDFLSTLGWGNRVSFLPRPAPPRHELPEEGYPLLGQEDPPGPAVPALSVHPQGAHLQVQVFHPGLGQFAVPGPRVEGTLDDGAEFEAAPHDQLPLLLGGEEPEAPAFHAPEGLDQDPGDVLRVDPPRPEREVQGALQQGEVPIDRGFAALQDVLDRRVRAMEYLMPILHGLFQPIHNEVGVITWNVIQGKLHSSWPLSILVGQVSIMDMKPAYLPSLPPAPLTSKTTHPRAPRTRKPFPIGAMASMDQAQTNDPRL